PECNVDIQYFIDVRRYPEYVLHDVDAIVYLAAISNDPMGVAFEKVTYDINHKACIAMARDAKKVGVKTFVYASSCSIYGFADGASKTEDSSLNPLTAYARSKVLAEQDLKYLANADFSVTSLRFSTACGMSRRLRLDLVLNDFVASAILTKKITVLSDGTPWRPLINVKDMARAIDWAIQRDPKNDGAFLAVNVGRDDWNYQVKELADTVAKAIPDIEVSINKDAPADKRSYRVNFNKYRTLAEEKYCPQEGLIATIKDLEDGIRAIGFVDTNFRESSFVRLKILKDLRAHGELSENLDWCLSSHKY
ncbi:MAG: SDR family oxidoreductase, partial [Atribacterota bacterium]|nr:SDR family oxidoreductase [Atribacterota bacterium]